MDDLFITQVLNHIIGRVLSIQALFADRVSVSKQESDTECVLKFTFTGSSSFYIETIVIHNGSSDIYDFAELNRQFEIMISKAQFVLAVADDDLTTTL